MPRDLQPDPHSSDAEPAAPSPDTASFELVWPADAGLGDGGWDLPERFELLRDLGDGVLGPVFAVRDTAGGGRVVRLEVVARAAAPSEAEKLALEQALRATSRVESAHLARCAEIGRLGDGRVFALREHAEGESLAERLAREGALHPDHALEIARQCARGLESLHSSGLAHGALTARSVWLAGKSPKNDANPFGVQAALLDAGVERRVLADGPQADLRALGELLRAMLGPQRNGSVRMEAARALADALCGDGALPFADAEQLRRALDALLEKPRASLEPRVASAAAAPSVRASAAAGAPRGESTAHRNALSIALAAALIGCAGLGWVAWRSKGEVSAAERVVADQRSDFERERDGLQASRAGLRAELTASQASLDQRSAELEAARGAERELRVRIEDELGGLRAQLESARTRAAFADSELESTRARLATAQAELQDAAGRSDGAFRAARGLDATLAQLREGHSAKAQRQAQLLESEGVFGASSSFVSTLATGFAALERFEASRAANDVAQLDFASLGAAEAALGAAREQRAQFARESAAWIDVAPGDSPAIPRAARVDDALALLGQRLAAARAERDAAHEREWSAIAAAPGIQDPARAFAHAERFACAHLEELATRFGRELRAWVLVGDALDVGRLNSFHQLGDWAARVRSGAVRLPAELERDVRLLADAQRWYDFDPSNDQAPEFSKLEPQSALPECKSWRDELALQWRLSRADSSFPLRSAQRAWRRSLEPGGQVEWWRESVEGADGSGVRVRRARYSADGRTLLGEGALRIERGAGRISIAGATTPLLDLRAHGAATAVSATPVEASIELPAELGAPGDLAARLRSAAASDACLIYIQGDVRRWISPRLGLVREETRTSAGVAVTQLIGLEP